MLGLRSGALVALLGGLMAGGSAWAAEAVPAARTYHEIVAARAQPRLDTLVARCRPDVTGDDASESFWDLLKLRDAPDPTAVPVLAEVLAANHGSNRIHRFAAAQALAALDTPAARETLAKECLDPAYPTDLASRYLPHWDASAAVTDRLVGDYLLRSLTDSLRLALTVAVQGDQVHFTLAAANTTAEELVVPARLFDAQALVLQLADGHYLVGRETAICDLVARDWLDIPPGETVRRELVLPLQRDTRTLAGGGIAFPLGAPGKVRAWALLWSAAPAPNARPYALPARGKLWWGRAVSAPAEFECPAP